MDDADHFLSLLLWCGLGAALVLVIYYAKYWVKGFFRGFQKLRTEAALEKMTRKSRFARFLSERLSGPSREERRARKANELMKAAEAGDLDKIKRLVQAGMDVNTRRGKGGKTAIMRAAQNGQVAVVRFLLEKGAHVDAAGGKSGKTALIRASEQGYVQVLELLIMAGADINAAGKVAGKTALMGAIEHGNPDAAVLLMKSGADFQVRDKKGRTVEDVAAQCGRRDWLDDLRRRETRFTSHIPPQNEPLQHADDDWYAILDSKKTDSPDQIKAKYHALMKQYHPDVVRAKGLPDDFLKLAHEKSLQIQEAYSKIMTKK